MFYGRLQFIPGILPRLIESTKKHSASVVPSCTRFLLCGSPHRLVSIIPQVFRIPPAASRQCSSTVSRELVGTIGSSDKYKDKNNWNKYEDGHKDKYKQELAQQHERPRVQPSSFILVSLKRRCPLKRNRRSRRESTRMGEMVNLELLFKNTHRSDENRLQIQTCMHRQTE